MASWTVRRPGPKGGLALHSLPIQTNLLRRCSLYICLHICTRLPSPTSQHLPPETRGPDLLVNSITNILGPPQHFLTLPCLTTSLDTTPILYLIIARPGRVWYLSVVPGHPHTLVKVGYITKNAALSSSEPNPSWVRPERLGGLGNATNSPSPGEPKRTIRFIEHRRRRPWHNLKLSTRGDPGPSRRIISS